VKLILALVAQRSRSALFDVAISSYLDRLSSYATVETIALRDESAVFDLVARQRARTPAWLILLDSRGKALSSEGLADWLAARRDSGQQTLVFAVGPADGWSGEARKRGEMLLSLGPMTLPHELARLVLVEQLYRAFTILAGHPYHSGH
jgi:23S rRNA (pseudouridine1915-N3)-methyltransferase